MYKYYCDECDNYFNIDIPSLDTPDWCPICGFNLNEVEPR